MLSSIVLLSLLIVITVIMLFIVRYVESERCNEGKHQMKLESSRVKQWPPGEPSKQNPHTLILSHGNRDPARNVPLNLSLVF